MVRRALVVVGALLLVLSLLPLLRLLISILIILILLVVGPANWRRVLQNQEVGEPAPHGNLDFPFAPFGVGRGRVQRGRGRDAWQARKGERRHLGRVQAG